MKSALGGAGDTEQAVDVSPRDGGPTPAKAEPTDSPGPEILQAQEELSQIIAEYKASLRELLHVRDRKVKFAEANCKALVDAGEASPRELEESKRTLAAARAELEDTRRQLKETTLVEAESSEEPDEPPADPLPEAAPGSGWQIADIEKVKDFFASEFGRQLPISALGQTDTHTRLGWDHRNAVDVAVRPESREGQALIAFLRDERIPFLAFSRAIPGKATAPHIHIGYPSHRIGA
jgi:hypothetical protein